MKKIKQLFIYAVMIVFVLCLQPQTISAASKDTMARKAYAKYLSKDQIYWVDKYFPSSKIQFSVLDVNNDKVPELYLCNPEAYGYQGYCALYGYVNGHVKEVYHFGNAQGMEAYYPSKGVFLDEGGRMGFYPCYYVKMNTACNTEIEFFSAKEEVHSNGNWTTVTNYYKGNSYSNKTPITKSDFQERRQRLLGNASKKIPVLRKNTIANRNRYILQSKNAASVELNKNHITLYLDGTKTYQLKATIVGASKKAVWSSNNRVVAKVSSNGKVTAGRAGTAVITVKANGKIDTCKVTVKKNLAVDKYKSFLKNRYKYDKCHYAIVNAGRNRSPVLIITQSPLIDRKYPQKTCTPDEGYPIELYNFIKGKVQCLSDMIPQSISAGPWYLYRNKLVTYSRRRGIYTLNISDYSFTRDFDANGVTNDFERNAKVVKLTRFS